MGNSNSEKKGPGSFSVKALEACTTPGRFADPITRGLYLQVSIRKGKTRIKDGEVGKSNVVKSWIFRYWDRATGKEHLMGLGSFDNYGLKEAREIAADQRKLLDKYKDPIASRTTFRTEMIAGMKNKITFASATQQYWEDQKSGWKGDKQADEWLGKMKNHAFPTLGAVQVNTITTVDVYKVLKPIWTTKAETASKLRGQIENVLDWCKSRGYLKGNNPATWKGNLKTQLPPSPRKTQKQHHPSLPYQQIGAFVESLRSQKGVGALSLELLILTASRTSEVTGAMWDEFQLDQSLWIIPAARMKAPKEHIVVLSPRALEIIRELEKTKISKYVFPGLKAGKPQSNAAMAALIDRMHMKKVETDGTGWVDAKGKAVVPHGFRATFRTWGGDRTDFEEKVLEHALAHQEEDEVKGSYDRGTRVAKRIPLMKAWADYCARPANNEANVIPIRAAQ